MSGKHQALSKDIFQFLVFKEFAKISKEYVFKCSHCGLLHVDYGEK